MAGMKWYACWPCMQLIGGYLGEDSEVVELVQRLDWFLLPVVNPDGYEYSHTRVCISP